MLVLHLVLPSLFQATLSFLYQKLTLSSEVADIFLHIFIRYLDQSKQVNVGSYLLFPRVSFLQRTCPVQ
jgi:hypothetical protein